MLYAALFHLPPPQIPEFGGCCHGIEPRAVENRHWHAVRRSNHSSRNDGTKLAGIRMIFPYIRTYFVYNSQLSSKMYRKGNCNNCRNLLTTEVKLKVLTNEKRDGLAVVSFDRSRFKLYSPKFSNKLVQAPSCERHKTAPRTLFLLFANYN